MSVLKNKRSESQLEFFNTATLIRRELTQFVMNEKVVPKRWRPVFTFPVIEKVTLLIDCIVAANTIYPTSLSEAEERRAYQTKAIITVEQIVKLLEYMLDTLPISADRFQNAGELLLKEGSLLRGWRKSDNRFFEQFKSEK